MTLRDRADAYNGSAWGQRYHASRLHVVTEKGGDVLYGTWCLGQDYRNKTTYYGAYPPSYLERIAAIFPDAGHDLLHAFSGSLPKGPYDRCDLIQPAEFQCSVLELPKDAAHRRWRLIVADPPYSAEDANKYGTSNVSRGAATSALAKVARPGAHLVWLDVCWPMFSKRDWRTAGRIALIRSTNHRVRLISIFERQA